jgi:hypothetical protein
MKTIITSKYTGVKYLVNDDFPFIELVDDLRFIPKDGDECKGKGILDLQK